VSKEATPRPRERKTPKGTHRSHGNTALEKHWYYTGTRKTLTYLSLKKAKATQVIRYCQRNRFIEIRSCSDDGYSNNLHGLSINGLYVVYNSLLFFFSKFSIVLASVLCVVLNAGMRCLVVYRQQSSLAWRANRVVETQYSEIHGTEAGRVSYLS
jgi:hypothetical protein